MVWRETGRDEVEVITGSSSRDEVAVGGRAEGWKEVCRRGWRMGARRDASVEIRVVRMNEAARRIEGGGGGGGLAVEKGPVEGGVADSRMAKSWGTTIAR